MCGRRRREGNNIVVAHVYDDFVVLICALWAAVNRTAHESRIIITIFIIICAVNFPAVRLTQQAQHWIVNVFDLNKFTFYNNQGAWEATGSILFD